MRRALSAIRSFFFPPPGSSRWLRLLPFAVLGAITLLAIYGSVEAWTYTNSPDFCGQTCHTMPPEYTTYLRSPHARVQCVECHLGRDVVTNQFTRKAGDLRHVLRTVTEDYQFPLYASEMRPATESCEKCHFPQKFSDDSLREVRHYGEDEANTPQSIFLIMKTGGGTRREGLGRGIHWHIENQVYFLATDPLQQDIPYVRVVDEQGKISEYYDVAANFTPDDVAGSYLQQMDCITCHNRVTHAIPDPAQAVEQALQKKLISAALPAVRYQAVTLLSQTYRSPEEARTAFQGLKLFYAQNYPDVSLEKAEAIQQAIDTLTDIYSQSNFPSQQIDWRTHPDNLGHKDFPGCFRCHDGKHLTATGEAIRLECNLCHAIPVVADASKLVTEVELVSGPEPVSHTHTSWIALHGKAIDSSCVSCHPPADGSVDFTSLEGKPPLDGSFCGNSTCHANQWAYTGFASQALRPILERQLFILLNTSPYLLEGVPRDYAGTFKAIFDGRCAGCHSGPEAEANLDLSQYASILAGNENGPGIVPGDLQASMVWQRQSQQKAHFGQLLEDELDALRQWILEGAPQ